MTTPEEPTGSLAEFFAASPLPGSGLVVDRGDDLGRVADLLDDDDQ